MLGISRYRGIIPYDFSGGKIWNRIFLKDNFEAAWIPTQADTWVYNTVLWWTRTENSPETQSLYFAYLG